MRLTKAVAFQAPGARPGRLFAAGMHEQRPPRASGQSRRCRAGRAQLLGQARRAQVQRRVPAPACVLRQRAGNPRLARSGRPADQGRRPLLDPARQRQAREGAALEASPGAPIDVLGASCRRRRCRSNAEDAE